MLLELPSLRFQPKFYTGGVSRFYLPLLYDLVALHQPVTIVTLGFGDGQAHFTLCQALSEEKVAGRCVTIRRERADENAADDEAWQLAIAESDEFYHGLTTLIAGNPVDIAATHAAGSIDILLLDDCDSYEIARAELNAWLPKLAPDGVVLFHGLNLKRPQPPRLAWEERLAQRPVAEFVEGIGLGVASAKIDGPFRATIFGSVETRHDLAALYRTIVLRVDAESRAMEAEKKSTALELRQVWLDTLIADRWQAQEIMDNQAREIAERAQAFTELQRDRGKAQLIMDAQAEQLRQWVGRSEALGSENKKLKKQLAQEKKAMKAAKKACRKNGRCFGSEGEKKRRSIPERILRELRRIPGNLSRAKSATPAAVAKKAAPEPPVDRYPEWIAQHEPDAAGLEDQRRAAIVMLDQPIISLLLPTYNPPANFLEKLLASIVAQTYGKFEICVADGGSDASTKELLQRWQERESRLRIEFLPENLGIAENTNCALALATGDFVACIDQDDLLAPFALYELARAIADNPQVDVFYSDEDRLGADGKRHSPFFKPEWSPEYLLSSMYLGHLTAYRRELVERVGKFRKEFDLSQDYDFAMRATEQARAVGHIPHVLYHWREHPASGSAGGKPHARVSNLAALAEAMRRRGLASDIIEYPTANRARLKVLSWPKVSIIVPTDSAERARACLEQLPLMTVYPDYEIVLVTNSALARELEVNQSAGRLVRYDKPFNFSDKCNAGAEAAAGSRLIFFNDDVESGQPDWIQNLIEPLENPEIGAVAPKLLYATGKIQHAGLVTGVRGLVGTACHQWPADSTIHANFAQSMRNASALSGACLALRKEDFLRVGGFDAVNTPVSHSDIDLCFKLRELALRCVYTPFATLLHAGHVSLVQEEKKPEIAVRRDKSSIYLLQRWAGDVTRDPYFTDNMRDWLYADSPTPIRMFGRNNPAPAGELDLLFISHDLSLSGAPLLLLYLARWFKQNGLFVTVMAPEDGPLRSQYQAAQIPLILDPLIMREHESFRNFLRNFDAVLANTIRGGPAIRVAKKERVPAIWWLHETLVGEHFLREDAQLRTSISQADVIFTPAETTASIYRPFTDVVPRRIPNGIPDLDEDGLESQAVSGKPLKFLLLGSVEPRKGQDVFAEALRRLPSEVKERAEFRIVGRVMDPEFDAKVHRLADGIATLTISREVDHASALQLLRETDVLVCAARDESMPVTILEAMSLGKVILSTAVGGVPEYISDGVNGILVKPERPGEIAMAVERLIRNPEELLRLRRGARTTFKQEFGIDRFGHDVLALVREVIAAAAERSSTESVIAEVSIGDHD